MIKPYELIDRIYNGEEISISEYSWLIGFHNDSEVSEYLFEKAREVREAVYGKDIYIRGLIEISNYCKNDCYYCGIRCSNKNVIRYRLTPEEILSCCDAGYPMGFRTFVLQGGEDNYYSEETVIRIVSEIKKKYPDVAVTLSLGERPYKEYKSFFEAGADRYLLRHETANPEHYKKLHPEKMSFENRMECLFALKEIGYQVGCGFMVGSPFQTPENIAEDILFINKFKPHMIGIGPFISQKDTPFKDYKNGTLEMTVFLIGLLRLTNKNALIPATTALGTISEDGRERGILAGANVVMPNLSPGNAREKYNLYDNKLHTGLESAEGLCELKKRFEKTGYKIITDRGDFKNVKLDKNNFPD